MAVTVCITYRDGDSLTWLMIIENFKNYMCDAAGSVSGTQPATNYSLATAGLL